VKAKAKPVPKAVPKAAPKSSSKAAPKAAPKAVPKPAPKVAAKAGAKTAAKAAAKTTAKAPAKSALKPNSKPLPKASTDKPGVKPAAKPVPKPAAKASTKPTPQGVIKAGAEPVVAKVVPPVVKAAVPATAAVPSAPPAPPARPAPSAPEPTRKSKSRAALAVAAAPVIPTHSPDAAKASYVSATERTIAPPPTAAVIRKDPKLANNWKTKRPEDLTDDEVKAMPDSEYMNDTQLAFFRLKLQKLKQDIHNSAGETTEHLREETVVVPDPADRATIEEEHALELRTRDRERKLLKKIEQSIGRIDAGDYGYCDETGEPIGVARLIARPTASLSLEAQQRRELKQKMFGD
jgi:DnaK suppressor protein